MLAPGSESGASADGGSTNVRSPEGWMEIRGLTKSFAGELALADADLDIARGEVHGLVGANGAGKSTLIRCLAGVTVPDHGRVTVGGEELRQGSPQASERAGLAFIHQELNLIPHFSALQNMLLGVRKVTRLGLIDWKRSSIRARAAADRVGIHFPLETRVSELSVAERWLVMIGKALTRDASLIAMDEPTASLSGPESEKLFSIIRDLSRHGVAILYVSHRLEEVLELCDRITVLRDGRIVDQAVRGRLDKKGLVRAIIGHDVRSAEDREHFTATSPAGRSFPFAMSRGGARSRALASTYSPARCWRSADWSGPGAPSWRTSQPACGGPIRVDSNSTESRSPSPTKRRRSKPGSPSFRKSAGPRA